VKKSGYTEEQILFALKQAEAGQVSPMSARSRTTERRVSGTRWPDLRITVPRLTCGDHRSGASGMSRMFRDDVNEMGYLTIVLCARKRSDQHGTAARGSSSIS
jgi:hypothetical protein